MSQKPYESKLGNKPFEVEVSCTMLLKRSAFALGVCAFFMLVNNYISQEKEKMIVAAAGPFNYAACNRLSARNTKSLDDSRGMRECRHRYPEMPIR